MSKEWGWVLSAPAALLPEELRVFCLRKSQDVVPNIESLVFWCHLVVAM